MCMVGVPEQNFEMWCVVSPARCALSSLLSGQRAVTELIIFLFPSSGLPSSSLLGVRLTFAIWLSEEVLTSELHLDHQTRLDEWSKQRRLWRTSIDLSQEASRSLTDRSFHFSLQHGDADQDHQGRKEAGRE